MPYEEPYAGPRFVSPQAMTVADVLSSYPASAPYRGMYVRVSDLFGFIDGVMRCGMDASTNYYFWQPTTPEYGRSVNVTSNNVSFSPLTSPTSILLTGSIGLGITRTITLDPTNGRPGEIKEIKAGSGLTSLLGSLNILGTGLGSGVGILLGDYRKFVLDNQSGTLTWVRLV